MVRFDTDIIKTHSRNGTGNYRNSAAELKPPAVFEQTIKFELSYYMYVNFLVFKKFPYHPDIQVVCILLGRR